MPSAPMPSGSQPEVKRTSVGKSFIGCFLPFTLWDAAAGKGLNPAAAFTGSSTGGEEPSLHCPIGHGQAAHEGDVLGHCIHVGALVRKVESLEIAARVNLELEIFRVQEVRAGKA